MKSACRDHVCHRWPGFPAAAEDMSMLQTVCNLLLGLSILPIGLVLAGSGGAGLWYVLTRSRSNMHYLVLFISPIQAAAGIFLVYKSYDFILRVFGIRLIDWL
jgi:hypothetical protein